MLIQIFRNNIEVVSVSPLDSSEHIQVKQSEDLIRLNFRLNEYVAINVGDYISYDKTEQVYFIDREPSVIEREGEYNYECVFKGSIHQLRHTRIMLGYDYSFPLTGNAKTLLEFVVENLNRTGGGYTAGKYEETEDVIIEFNNWNGFEACNEICSKLGISWYMIGKQLNFGQRNFETAIVLQVGMNIGFTSLTRTSVESEDIATVVYGYGSSDNLPPRFNEDKGGVTYNSILNSDNRLYFKGVNGESKLEKNIDKFGRRELIVEFNDIKAERTGVVTSLGDDMLTFYDTEMDFDVNVQLMSGVAPKLKFSTGALMNIEFEFNYDHSTKRYMLIKKTEDTGEFPNDTLKPKVGDKYKLYDIIMPQTYIDAATNKLKEATQEHINVSSTGLVNYEGEIDASFVELNKVVFDIGYLVRVVSPTFELDDYFEIKALTQNIVHPNRYKIQFGDLVGKNILQLIKEQQFNTSNRIYNVTQQTITKSDVVNIKGGETAVWETW